MDESVVVNGQHTWPIQISAVSTTVGLPSEIFVYHASMGDDPIIGDVFEAVASVHQLSEIQLVPIPDNGSGGSIPFYRSATLTFNCRTPEEADRIWTVVQADALDLLNNVKALAELTTEEIITFS